MFVPVRIGLRSCPQADPHVTQTGRREARCGPVLASRTMMVSLVFGSLIKQMLSEERGDADPGISGGPPSYFVPEIRAPDIGDLVAAVVVV